MKDIRLVIFDLDGTLVNAYPAIIESFNFTMQKLNYPGRDRLTIRRAVGWGDQALLEPFLKPEDLSRALALYRRHHKKALLRGARLLPGARRVPDSLKNKGYLMAVASNRPTRFSRILMRHLKLEKYFASFLCADKLKKGKPHPEILQRIMRRLSCKPQETLYVGDMAIDARAGSRAGVRTVIVTTGSSHLGEIRKERPFKVIDRISRLLKLLSQA
ncbi:MAG: HAD family hydrolase [Candidatus Omnitrophica bacterium]|nr:HAD family hydrolase [Candidatus Omnitrophota bacterium]